MEPLFTAIPTKSYATLLYLLFATLGLIIFVVLVETNRFKKIKGAYKQISFLLGSLLAFLLLATTLLTTWDLYRIQPIKLYESHLECYQGKIPYKEITRAGIYTDEQKSLVNPDILLKQNKMLVLDRKNAQATIFSAEYFEVEDLVRKIRKQMGRSEE